MKRNKPTEFAKYLHSFLVQYLANEKNVSHNTVKSYATAFKLLLDFLYEEMGMNPDRIEFDDINSEVIIEYLEWMEKTRNISISTRNQRLAAIKSFYKYVSKKSPSMIYTCSSIIWLDAKSGMTNICLSSLMYCIVFFSFLFHWLLFLHFFAIFSELSGTRFPMAV